MKILLESLLTVLHICHISWINNSLS
uniref:Uncharacterized protein n=1 Tax=Rhizophora mucronata TaxID=61149 RepID=A0A2P2NIS8_RHIMU